MKKEYIDIVQFKGDGYLPLINYEHWRVAMLRYCDELLIENIKKMQKHNETDEVFVLLEGNCTLFTGGNKDAVCDIDGIPMEPLKLYNVKQGVWHTHTLAPNSSVLIVENLDTCDDNSPEMELSGEQIEELKRIFAITKYE